MKRARYLNEQGNYEFVYADKITGKEYDNKFKGKIFCEEDGCSAEMIFYERQIGRKEKIFKTRPRDIHKKGCRNEIKRNLANEITISLVGESVNVTDNHIKKVLKDAYRDYYKKIHKLEGEEPTTNNKKKSKLSKKTDETTKKSYKYKNTPTTSGDGVKVVSSKEPSIYKREVSEIREKDESSYREVHGIIKNFKIYDDEIFITLSGIDGEKLNIYIGMPFKISSPQEFKLLKNCEMYFLNSKNEIVICNCVGQITSKGKDKIVQVFSSTDVTFDGFSIVHITNLMQNLIQKS